ncbi:hypothetical protein BDV37DRAFT_269732 [Aspergillus pseudonomiae]|uniref:Heterokaryon incompatibility domain-containing protein n=1 Tax=Aspergillus pseudonomiae TaxID=1506151 RepID=A0A5N7DKR9_9EURO|nr:uncharacterized protein BDV37DRAFT_269732 [Aspergillus pseudonomiae]KAE8406699.1 hypothetical protein BDV37DRAFT_269732 [Aspergillus pseudonomiae]
MRLSVVDKSQLNRPFNTARNSTAFSKIDIILNMGRINEWRIQRYTEVPREILDHEGYGVVSYTWGYIAQWEKPASDTPEGVVWTVPTTSKWPLARARQVMEKMGTRYVWWDWMCVPQGLKHQLDPELFKAKGEEIGKQLHIYKNAAKSIVWLHPTSWDEDSAMKDLLLEMSRPGNQEPKLVQEYTEKVENWLRTAQMDEHWLKSGWTLQEGVLLGSTLLIDGHGNTFSDSRFYNGSQATVRDLSIPVSVLARNSASAYFIQSEGHDPDTTRPGAGQFGHLLPKSPESVIWLRRSIQTLAQSGLVGFFTFSPLSILCGKNSRKYGMIQDSCWALIGAMEVENIEVSYDFPKPEIKRRFLSALVDKYQWMMLFLPFWECQVEEEGATGTVKRPFQWTDIVDDALLPASLFVVESHTDPELPLEKEPTLHFSDEDFISEDLRVKARDGQRISLFRVSKDYITYFCHYRQDSNGLRIVSSQTVTVAEDPLLANAWLLPLWNVDMKGDVRGKRCLLVLRLEGPTAMDQPVHAAFGGMIDVGGMGSEKVDIREMSLASC